MDVNKLFPSPTTPLAVPSRVQPTELFVKPTWVPGLYQISTPVVPVAKLPSKHRIVTQEMAVISNIIPLWLLFWFIGVARLLVEAQALGVGNWGPGCAVWKILFSESIFIIEPVSVKTKFFCWE